MNCYFNLYNKEKNIKRLQYGSNLTEKKKKKQEKMQTNNEIKLNIPICNFKENNLEFCKLC